VYVQLITQKGMLPMPTTCMVVTRSACTASVFSLYLGRGLYVRVRSVRESAETDRELDDLPSVAG